MLDYRKLYGRSITFPQDCQRIQKICKEHGEEISLYEAEDLWIKYSETMSAGWLVIDDYADTQVWFNIKDYFI